MLEDLKMRTSSEGLIVEDPSGLLMSPHTAHRAKQLQVLDLERNILQVCIFKLSLLFTGKLIDVSYLIMIICIFVGVSCLFAGERAAHCAVRAHRAYEVLRRHGGVRAAGGGCRVRPAVGRAGAMMIFIFFNIIDHIFIIIDNGKSFLA
jgi:hypothetical protein